MLRRLRRHALRAAYYAIAVPASLALVGGLFACMPVVWVLEKLDDAIDSR